VSGLGKINGDNVSHAEKSVHYGEELREQADLFINAVKTLEVLVHGEKK
jgi:hypothetical protein